MQSIVTRARIGIFTSLFLVILAALSGAASAGAVGSEYTYNFAGATGTVTNTAAANNEVNLTLFGNWVSNAGGAYFSGDRLSERSVGYAKPANGNTITVPATSAVGGEIKFTYKAPVTSNCFGDSVNLTQIGRFAAKTAQLKIQLSKCGQGILQTNVYPECRVAGALTPNTVLPVRGTTALINGQQYVISCIKSADPTSGKPTVQLKTTQLIAAGNVVTTNTFLVAKTGALNSVAYLSVANKYPLPAVANNTDQYVGAVSAVSYCKLASIVEVEACLVSEIAPAL